MVWIELKKILKEGIIIILILTGLMVHILTTDRDPYTASVIFEIFLLLYASFTGWSMFDRERQEGAVEYLLSMPVSRTRLFFLKFIPRTFSVLLLLGVYLLLHSYFDFPSFRPLFDFSLIYLAFFLVSLAFSLTLKNFIGALFITSFLSLGLTLLLKVIDPAMSDSSAILAVNLVILIFPAAFFIVFQRFDIKPIRTFNWKFVPPMVVIIGMMVGVAWLMSSSGWRGYYITHDGDLTRYSSRRTQIIRKSGEVINLNGCLRPLMEVEGSMYMEVIKMEKKYKIKKLVSLDLQKASIRPIMDVKDGWYTGHGYLGKDGVLKKGIYYNILQNREKKECKILMIHGTSVRGIPVYGNFYNKPIKQLFHVVEEPLQFFVMNDVCLYRIYKNGEAEELPFCSDALAVWENRLLVFDQQGMTLYEISDQLKPIFQKKGKIRKLRRKFGSLLSSKVLIKEEKGFHLFSLEDQSLEPVDLCSRPYYYFVSGDTLHLLWVSGDEMTYGQMVDGKIIKQKKWIIKVKQEKGWRVILPYPSGVVVYNKKEYEKYLFDK
jgi:hypothetical protein